MAGPVRMPLLIRMVTIEPGMVWPLGDVPTTVPYRDPLLTEADVLGDLEAGFPHSLTGGVLAPAPTRRAPASSGPPSTKSGSVGGSLTSPKLLAIGFMALNQVRAGSLPPNRLPS